MTESESSSRVDLPPFGAVGAPWWDDATAYLVGGGSSLIGFDFSRLAGRGHVLGVNKAMFDAPVEAGITIDHVFVRNYANSLRGFAGLRDLYMSVGNEWWKTGLPTIADAIYLRSMVCDWLSFVDRTRVRKVPTSGLAALNVAVLKGARRIVLLGYDYGSLDGRHHYHQDYMWYRKAQDQSWDVWARAYRGVAAACADRGIEIINASPRSRLTCFKKCSLDEAMV